MDFVDLLTQTAQNSLPRVDPAIEARKVLDTYAEWNAERAPFKPGDLVVARPYTIYSRPLKGQVSVVMEVLSKPIVDERQESGSCQFGLSLDVIVGCYGDHGSFTLFHQSSRYLEPYTGPVEPAEPRQ
jgi:hypothetical protein